MDDVDRLFQCFKCGVSTPGTLSASLYFCGPDPCVVCVCLPRKCGNKGNENQNCEPRMRLGMINQDLYSFCG